jgi:hypothetical protein
MTVPTNPFASALEGGYKEEQEQPFTSSQQYNSHNPFAAAAPSTTSTAAAPATNPFAQSSNTFGGNSEEYTAPVTLATNTARPAATQYESANNITQQLSGLDFSGGAASTDSYSQQPAYTAPQEQLAPTPAFSQQTRADSLPPSQDFAAPPIMATSVAAPTSFPTYSEPATTAPSGYENESTSRPTTTQQQNPFSSATQTDEMYARQLLADDEEDMRQRRQNGQPRQTSNGAGAYQTAAPIAATPSTTEEKQWNTKEIYWQGRLQRMIIQNENGPCSLIALCNILLLRGTVQLVPEDRPAVSYTYLASLLGEHLIDVISTSGAENAMDLEAALSIIPQTQVGLDVNVSFSSI